MAIHYNGNIMGTITIAQQSKDENKPRKFKIQIRQGNCLAVFLYVYKKENPEAPKKCWVHELITFFADEQHIKNCEKNFASHDPIDLFYGKIVSVKLNLFYKESRTLLKYIVKHHEVKCYYKEENK